MDKDLLKQLNILKEIKASEEWKNENRNLLLRQINADAENFDFGKKINFNYFVGFLDDFLKQGLKTHKFATVFSIIVLFVFGGGFFSIKAAQKTKPGDSLYIAKIVKEKTQLAFTFDEKEKARLGIQFAGNRVKELEDVLKSREGDKKETVNKLVNDFKKEIKSAKQRIAKINKVDNTKLKKIKVTKKVNLKPEQEKIGDKKNSKQEDKTQIVEGKEPKDNFNVNNEAKDEGVNVFSANLSKDKQGIQIAEQKSAPNDFKSAELKKDDLNDASVDEKNDVSTSTSEKNADLDDKNSDLSSPQEILKQADELLLADDYEASLSKLEVLNNVDVLDVIDGDDNEGEVKGVDEVNDEAESDENVIKTENLDVSTNTAKQVDNNLDEKNKE